MDEAALIQTIMKAYRTNTCHKNQFACVQPLQGGYLEQPAT